MATEFVYNASRTCSAFHLAAPGYEFKGIRGPVGSGKSVACCFEIFLKSQTQKVVRIVEDGAEKKVRWSKWLIGRHTYPALIKTTIETWLNWFGPKTVMHWGAPLSGRYEDYLPDGTLLRIDLEFAALDAKNILNDLMSFEISGAWVNEATQVAWRVIDRIHDRIGRFKPDNKNFGDSFGVIMDTNSPDETNWWYTKERVVRGQRRSRLREIRHSAGGKRRKPERGLLLLHKQIPTKSADDIKKLILNEYGTSIDGKPVYPEYNDEIHYAGEEIPVQRGLTLLLGSDFGRTPATVIAQLGRDGVLYVLDEVGAENMSAEQFIEELLRPKLINEYGFPSQPLINFGDPAGANYNEVVSVSAIETFNLYGILTKPAPATNGNRTQLRVDCVSELLRRSYKGRAAVRISSRCKMLRKGFNGYYCYRRMRIGGVEGDERYTEEPDKNAYSHFHDAFQYVCMGVFKSGVDYSVPQENFRPHRHLDASQCGVDFDCV